MARPGPAPSDGSGDGALLRVLYVCYLSPVDPLVQTQVVAYLAGLVERGHTVHLLTFDGELMPSQRAAIEAGLSRRGITWHSLRYHKRPSLPATMFDTVRGAIEAARIVRRHNLGAIHARSEVPAAMGLIARRWADFRLIFDVRGLMAEEYVDAGRWRDGGLRYRLTKRARQAALRRADGVVMLTEAARPHLGDGNPAANGRVVIPCCADLDRIAECAGERTATREELGVTERFVMVYVGKFGGWYMHEAMVNYYKVAQQRDPELFFLIVTQDDATPVLRELERRGVGPQDYRILSADPHDLGRYLAASDFGISLIRPCFSKIASSPTKIGEYLGAGLPVLSTAGIGDIDRLLLGNRVGVLVRDFSEAGFVAAAAEIRDLCAAPDIRRRCSDVARRELALREVGIPRYDKLYRDVAAGL